MRGILLALLLFPLVVFANPAAAQTAMPSLTAHQAAPAANTTATPAKAAASQE
jgi:hypothetical protein